MLCNITTPVNHNYEQFRALVDGVGKLQNKVDLIQCLIGDAKWWVKPNQDRYGEITQREEEERVIPRSCSGSVGQVQKLPFTTCSYLVDHASGRATHHPTRLGLALPIK